jgi:hypothetical protein
VCVCIVSEEVLAEYKQLKARYETEKAKTDAAAKYASQVSDSPTTTVHTRTQFTYGNVELMNHEK